VIRLLLALMPLGLLVWGLAVVGALSLGREGQTIIAVGVVAWALLVALVLPGGEAPR